MHCKDQAWKHKRSSIGQKRISIQWFAMDSIGKKKLWPLRFAVSVPLFYWRIPMGLTDNRTTAKNFAVRLKKLKNFNRFWSSEECKGYNTLWRRPKWKDINAVNWLKF